jgi:competence protein ComGC
VVRVGKVAANTARFSWKVTNRLTLMKNNPDDFKRASAPGTKLTSGSPAFTLTELVVILAVIAFLAATLLPALANTKFRTGYAGCTSNLRQWGVVANAFSTDNQGKLPSFPMSIGYAGGNLWDVDAAMTTNLVPYGVTVQMWFCPARPGDFQSIANANPGVAITSPTQFAALNNPSGQQGIEYNHKYLTIFYSVYIPRQLGFGNSGWWPVEASHLPPGMLPAWRAEVANPAIPFWSTGTPWPLHASDKWSGSNPIMTDTLFDGSSADGGGLPWNQVFSPAGGHPYGGKIVNINLLYADGRLVVHNASQFIWTWDGRNNQFANYY